MNRCGGIVLCGGRSRRMGRPKATLPFGPEAMLARVVRLLGEAVEPIVVVAAAGQPLPPLPAEVAVVCDARPQRGPLEGIAAGMRALARRAEAAFVTACDVPLLQPAFVRRVVELLDGFDAAVPHANGFDQPLAAVYRLAVLAEVEALLAVDRLRPVMLFDAVRTRRVAADELAAADPELLSLANVNTPEAYAAALARAGFIGVQLDNAACCYPHPTKPGSRWSPLLHDQPEVQ
jgi:molybdopterin-guanine dinucleotide biosynthesis protein A